MRVAKYGFTSVDLGNHPQIGKRKIIEAVRKPAICLQKRSRGHQDPYEYREPQAKIGNR
jgi:hypothetical protein